MSAQSGRRVLVNTSALTAASFWRIIASFGAQILVARLLSVAALGDFALMLAWLHVAQVASEAGLPVWMVRELVGKPERRRALWRHVLGLQVMLALLAALGLILLAWLLPAGMPSPALVAIAAASLPFYAVMSATLALFESAEAFHLVFVVDVTTNALLLAATALLLWSGYGLTALFAALTLLQLFAALFALWMLRRSKLAHGDGQSVANDTRRTWRATLRSSGSYFTLAITDVLQQRADLLLLGALLSPVAVGLYAAASSIVRVAIKLIQAYWRALFPTLGRLHEGDEPTRFTQLAAIGLRYGATLAVGFSLALTFLAPWLTPLLFGSDFSDASLLLAVMVWSSPFYFYEAYVVTLLLVQRRQRSAVNIAIAHLALLIGALLLLVGGWGALGGAIANVVAAAAAAVQGAFMLRSGNPVEERGVLVRLLLATVVAFGAGSASWWLLQNRGVGVPWASNASALLSLLIYAAVAFLARLLRAEDVTRIRQSLARQS